MKDCQSNSIILSQCRVRMAILLVLNGAIGYANNEGRTAADVARDNGHREVAQVLKEVEQSNNEVRLLQIEDCTRPQKILFCTLVHCKICLNA